MFTTFFKMSAMPFSEKLPVSALLTDERIKQGLARLTFMAQQGTFALIYGEEGVGKSSLLRLFINSLGKKHYHPIYIHLTHLDAPGFLQILVGALGEKPLRGKQKNLLQILAKTHQREVTTVLLIDEAHHLNPDSLIDLRLLASSATDESDRLKIVFSAHPDIKKELRRARHASLVQRTAVQYHLNPLSDAQTHAYIDYHIDRVGCTKKLFDPDVKTSIHEHARGVPRLINNIATACLITAASLNSQKVTAEILAQALPEIDLF